MLDAGNVSGIISAMASGHAICLGQCRAAEASFGIGARCTVLIAASTWWRPALGDREYRGFWCAEAPDDVRLEVRPDLQVGPIALRAQPGGPLATVDGGR